jgi:hypothetical protein
MPFLATLCKEMRLTYNAIIIHVQDAFEKENLIFWFQIARIELFIIACSGRHFES